MFGLLYGLGHEKEKRKKKRVVRTAHVLWEGHYCLFDELSPTVIALRTGNENPYICLLPCGWVHHCWALDIRVTMTLAVRNCHLSFSPREIRWQVVLTFTLSRQYLAFFNIRSIYAELYVISPFPRTATSSSSCLSSSLLSCFHSRRHCFPCWDNWILLFCSDATSLFMPVAQQLLSLSWTTSLLLLILIPWCLCWWDWLGKVHRLRSFLLCSSEVGDC